MSATRQMRRAGLALTGRAPAPETLEAAAAAGDGAQAVIDAQIDTWLGSNEFYRKMVAFGHDWITVGKDAVGFNEGAYHGSQAANLVVCDASSPHPGAFALSSEDGSPDECANASATVTMVAPWWNMSTMVPVVGRAGTGLNSYVNSGGESVDCGLTEHGYTDNVLVDAPDYRCSCGPNLVHCLPYGARSNGQGDPGLAPTQAFDEPARLLAHLAWHDRPLSDLVIGNYTVAPLFLRHLYRRHGRQIPANAHLDADTSWYQGPFNSPSDPEHTPSDAQAWNEVVVEKLNPHLLSLTGGVAGGSLDRRYTYDPRTTTEEIQGMPAAGVLTMPAALSSFARERVRAARFIEIFACRDFIPPPATFVFNDFDRDPATTGTCQHCHRTLDPGSVFFKRLSFRPSGTGGLLAVIGGVAPYRFPIGTSFDYDPYRRWVNQFLTETVLTPVTVAQAEQNPEALLIDFLGEGTTLFGEPGDGTVGPLGFGKILVESGEFDRCAVRRLYKQFVGRELNTATEAGYIDSLAATFVSGERKLRPFIQELMRTDDFRRGL